MLSYLATSCPPEQPPPCSGHRPAHQMSWGWLEGLCCVPAIMGMLKRRINGRTQAGAFRIGLAVDQVDPPRLHSSMTPCHCPNTAQ
jgi:hypothetical protein